MKVFALILAVALLCGCTAVKKRFNRLVNQQSRLQAELTEESRTLTTAVVDTLSIAPTNPATSLALDLARQDQTIEGAPIDRIDVKALLAGEAQATNHLAARFDRERNLLAQNKQVQEQLRQAETRLIEMGHLYEKERNRGIVKRIWHWGISTLGIGGVIALCVLCPTAIPLLGAVLGWVVKMFPKLYGFIGVVSKSTFDNVIIGFEEAKRKLKEEREVGALATFKSELQKSTDRSDKAVIAQRKATIGLS